jgi:large conductance mechanosensitive channel
MKTLNDFKAFILRGNVVDLAVGIVIGAAFSGIVTAFVKDIMTPLIGLPGKLDLSRYHYIVRNSDFQFGDFLNAVISFLIVAAVIFFLVVRPVNALLARAKTEAPPDPTTQNCPFCYNTIPLQATRCGFCTSEVPKAEMTSKS